MLDSLVRFESWLDPELGIVFVEASNGYTKARASFDPEFAVTMRDKDGFERLKREVAKALRDDLHWRTPLAHAHRRTDGNSAPHGS